jgi:polyphosphate kinase
MLTADPEVGADLTDLFNVLTGYSRQTAFRRLLVAPHGVRSGIIERIEREAAKAATGEPALVQIKVNALVDEELIDALYRASQAGVRVDLVIRGICTLRPGVPGLSDNIRVRSILGRFLEHSRVFRFGAGDPTSERVGQGGSAARPDGGSATRPDGGSAAGPHGGSAAGPEWWIGSADLMHRNLDRRVEALVRVTDASARGQLGRLMDLSMSPETSAFELAGDGSWKRRVAGPDGQPLVNPQETLLRRLVHRSD